MKFAERVVHIGLWLDRIRFGSHGGSIIPIDNKRWSAINRAKAAYPPIACTSCSNTFCEARSRINAIAQAQNVVELNQQVGDLRKTFPGSGDIIPGGLKCALYSNTAIQQNGELAEGEALDRLNRNRIAQ